MSNKLFLITTNNKRFEEWVKQNRIKLMKMKTKQHLTILIKVIVTLEQEII